MNTATFSDPLDFSGKTVLVVGGSSGIGNGIDGGLVVNLWRTLNYLLINGVDVVSRSAHG